MFPPSSSGTHAGVCEICRVDDAQWRACCRLCDMIRSGCFRVIHSCPHVSPWIASLWFALIVCLGHPGRKTYIPLFCLSWPANPESSFSSVCAFWSSKGLSLETFRVQSRFNHVRPRGTSKKPQTSLIPWMRKSWLDCMRFWGSRFAGFAGVGKTSPLPSRKTRFKGTWLGKLPGMCRFLKACNNHCNTSEQL